MDLTVDFTETPVEPNYPAIGVVNAQNFHVNANRVQKLNTVSKGELSVDEYLEEIDKVREEIRKDNVKQSWIDAQIEIEAEPKEPEKRKPLPGRAGQSLLSARSEIRESVSENVTDEGGESAKEVPVISVFFDIDSSEIDSVYRESLNKFVDHRSVDCVRVGGSASDIGDWEHNLDLSQQRADTVEALLSEKGIDVLATQGLGDFSARLWGSDHFLQQRVDVHVVDCN